MCEYMGFTGAIHLILTYTYKICHLKSSAKVSFPSLTVDEVQGDEPKCGYLHCRGLKNKARQTLPLWIAKCFLKSVEFLWSEKFDGSCKHSTSPWELFSQGRSTRQYFIIWLKWKNIFSLTPPDHVFPWDEHTNVKISKPSLIPLWF